jgi:hypothetical protein
MSIPFWVLTTVLASHGGVLRPDDIHTYVFSDHEPNDRDILNRISASYATRLVDDIEAPVDLGDASKQGWTWTVTPTQMSLSP